MATAESTILRPLPRRTFAITPASNESSRPQSPTPDTMPSSPNPCLLDPRYGLDNTPSRTGSIMNLTSSTLYGIYSPTTDTEREDPPTPWGTSSLELNRRMTEGEQPAMPQWERPRTPLRVPLHPTDFRSWALPLVSRTILLFAFGVAYGVIITHLHDNRHVVPVRLELEGVDRYNLVYLIFWGVAGVGLGSLLPLVDSIWEETANSNGLSKNSAEGLHHGGAIKLEDSPSTMASQSGSGLGADWNPVVRGVGAFVGIAFAIRKLPWQSTLQVSLTLALVNPVLWYLIDRSKSGFLLSTVVGLTGTALLLGVNPGMVPTPSLTVMPSNSSWSISSTSYLSTEHIGVGTWIASVLFCSCVCFGNIGRRLAFKKESL